MGPAMSSPEQAVARGGAAEEALLARLRVGDGVAFAEAVRPHQQLLLRLAGRFVATQEDAEDVVQEALVEGYRQMRRFRGDASLGTWLGRIVIRKAMRSVRRARRKPVSMDAECAEAAGDEAERISVRAAVARLPQKLRVPVVLRFYEGLSGAEMAEMVGCRQSTVWTRLYRGLKRLREELAEEGMA